MNSYLHRSFSMDSPALRARALAESIFVKLQILGTRQVRLHRGMFLTYPYPARRGYGTRGTLIGIYTLATRLEWIEEDVSQMLSGEKS